MDEGLRDRRDRRADALAGENARVSKVVLGGCSASNHPPPLEWDDVTFIETGTGRRGLSDDERAILGDRASLFPLLA